MKDPAIRNILKNTELVVFQKDKATRVVEELKLPVASARIDIAVINGHLHGYEIKGSQDTLQRLPGQLHAYSKVFDYLTVVTELKYCEKIIQMVPEWVGVSICSIIDGKGELEIIQPPIHNTAQEGFYIAKLLWQPELVEVLTEQNIFVKKNLRSWLLCELLAEHFDSRNISNFVRQKIKQRKNWKTTANFPIV